MPLHFSESELAHRREQATATLLERGLDGLLMFRQESMYYLTGYDTTGYATFQCLFMSADGRLTLLTRAPDLRQARRTSIIDDIRIWVDRPEANPGRDLREILDEHGCGGTRLGIEYDAFGLGAHHARMVEDALHGFCRLVDASDLVSRHRLIKSEAELVYVRRAAELSDAALEAGRGRIAPGTPAGRLFAAMHGAIFEGGGDYAAGRFIISSGNNALFVRHFTGHEDIGEQDQVTLEFGAAYRHYHACLMRTDLTGEVNPRHRTMHSACVEALAACQEACKPGNMVGDVFDAHARVLDQAGFREHRLNACGYSLGATYPPSWMDWPMLFSGNSVPIEQNMVFFMHMILLDSGHGLAMSSGETVHVTETGCERLSRTSYDLVVH